MVTSFQENNAFGIIEAKTTDYSRPFATIGNNISFRDLIFEHILNITP